MVITRETRDVFLQYLHKIITDSNIEVAKGQEHIPTTDVTHATEDTETVFSKDNYNTHTTTSITGFNKTITELVENKYESMKKNLTKYKVDFQNHGWKELWTLKNSLIDSKLYESNWHNSMLLVLKHWKQLTCKQPQENIISVRCRRI